MRERAAPGRQGVRFGVGAVLLAACNGLLGIESADVRGGAAGAAGGDGAGGGGDAAGNAAGAAAGGAGAAGADVAGCPDPATKRCGGACVRRDDPASGCGAETCAPCALPPFASAAACRAGACAVGTCQRGTFDLDAVAENGCERRAPPVAANAVLWLTADAGVSCGGSACVEGAKVSSWADQTDDPWDAVQTDPALQPTWQLSAANGRPALRLAAGSYLRLAHAARAGAFDWSTFNQGFSAFVVANPASLASGPVADAPFFDFGDGSFANNVVFGRLGTSANYALRLRQPMDLGFPEFVFGSDGSYALTDGAWGAYGVVIGPGGGAPGFWGGALYFSTKGNGFADQVPAPAVGPRGVLYVGRSNGESDGARPTFEGELGEIMVFEDELGTPDIQELVAYFQSKWQLGGSVGPRAPGGPPPAGGAPRGPRSREAAPGRARPGAAGRGRVGPGGDVPSDRPRRP